MRAVEVQVQLQLQLQLECEMIEQKDTTAPSIKLTAYCGVSLVMRLSSVESHS